MSRTALGLAVMLVASVLMVGITAPQPAEANDTGRIIAGLAAGALVYGLLGNDHNSRSQNYQGGNRGYYNGNSNTWDCRPPRPNQGNRQAYNRGYNTGWNNGYNTGYNRGWNNGADYGYSRGYNRGYDNGYSDGRWGGWGY